jgi:hypothetical protein
VPPSARDATRAKLIQRIQSADAKLAEHMPLSDVDALARTAEEALTSFASPGARVRGSLTGEPSPTPAELIQLRRENLLRGFAERRRLLADALAVGDVAELLGVGRQTPHDRVRAGTLLAVKDNGKLAFPAWQFDPEGPDGVLSGLPEVLQALGGTVSPLGRVRWFLQPKALLNGRTPLGCLRDGELADVMVEASATGVS